MELKFSKRTIDGVIYKSSNRTFMELKSKKGSVIASFLNGSNRTFMELKLPSTPYLPIPSFVLIAPLWNWNDYMEYMEEVLDGSNRTFMELKLIIPFQMLMLF